MNEKPIRIVLVDDHNILREGLKQVLTKFPSVQMVGEAGSVDVASDVVAREKPEIVVLDLNLGDRDGLEWAKQALARHPGLKIVVLTSVEDPARVQEAMRSGVSAYLLKTNGAEELVRALQLARDGHLYLCPEVMTAMLRNSSVTGDENLQRVDDPARLSDKDREIVRLVALGLRNKEIAEQLSLTPKTVETYRVRLMHRLGCESTADLVRWAIRERLITP